ncbi:MULTISPECIES: gas vesicle protein [Bacillaceae]|uniref:Gas vesicle protein n=1 Tax=Metabacillus sediminis TaxID=3117746 RepID=A0ABZ2NG05_9BACI|nr:gas vesicle protein [Bacillus sp. SJS]KZZ83311.1 gas vesicle protein GvpS [Bacillus sp. SJS]
MDQPRQIDNSDVSLLDILDVILDKGVVLRGDLIISIAGIDLIYLDLRVLISAVETLVEASGNNTLSSTEMDREREELVYVTESRRR